MEKTYTFKRNVNGRNTVVAEITKRTDGSAYAEDCNRGPQTFDSADSAFASIRGWLAEMDGCNGWSG